mgnify:CR=1 FL=1
MVGDFDGIGMTLGADVQGIDLDDCRDPETGELNELAQEVLNRIDGYAEVSPSGTGIKLFAKTNLDGSRTKKEAGVELYREGRYFTVTGRVLGPNHTDLSDKVQALDWLIETHVHADHLSAAPYIQRQLGGGIGIGSGYRKKKEPRDRKSVV